MIHRASTIVLSSTDNLTPGDWLQIDDEFMRIIQITQPHRVERNEDGSELVIPGRVLVERKVVP